MNIMLISCSETKQSVISDYKILYKPIRTTPLDTCDTIIQADNQRCTYIALYGNEDEKQDCLQYRSYQEVYKDNRRVGCSVKIINKE